MQSFLGLLGHIFQRASHAPQRNQAAEAHLDSGETHVYPPVFTAISLPTSAHAHRAEAPPCKNPLRVKLYRDNQRDCNPFPTRLVISGRMADVHAELERLAAMEALT